MLSEADQTSRKLVVSLHDVSPLTWEASREILAQLKQIGVANTSLLVVPNHHFKAPLKEHPEFCSWLEEMADSGHEIVLHGFHHLRKRKHNENLLTRFTTRIYTADEGEFFDIGSKDAEELLERGLELFLSLNLQVTGFIAPAWLLSEEGENAARKLGLLYTTRLREVKNLQTNAVTISQSQVYSVRSFWRRQISLAWNKFLAGKLSASPLQRISIHPVDFRHPAIRKQILHLTARALQTRAAITYHNWVQPEASPSSIHEL